MIIIIEPMIINIGEKGSVRIGEKGSVRAYVQTFAQLLSLRVARVAERGHGTAHVAAMAHGQLRHDPLVSRHHPTLQPFHPGDEIRFRRLQKEIGVITHQHIAMHLHPRMLRHLHHRRELPAPRHRSHRLPARRAHPSAQDDHRPDPRGHARSLGEGAEARQRITSRCINCVALFLRNLRLPRSVTSIVNKNRAALGWTLTLQRAH